MVSREQFKIPKLLHHSREHLLDALYVEQGLVRAGFGEGLVVVISCHILVTAHFKSPKKSRRADAPSPCAFIATSAPHVHFTYQHSRECSKRGKAARAEAQ